MDLHALFERRIGEVNEPEGRVFNLRPQCLAADSEPHLERVLGAEVVEAERGGYIYRNPDGSIEVRAREDPGATPCSMSPAGPTPEPDETVVGVWHTHPFSHLDPLPSTCGRPAKSAYDNVSRGGGSREDWELIDTPYQGQKLPMYIIDKEEVFRLDPDTPPADRPSNPNRWDWNTPKCPW